MPLSPFDAGSPPSPSPPRGVVALTVAATVIGALVLILNGAALGKAWSVLTLPSGGGSGLASPLFFCLNFDDGLGDTIDQCTSVGDICEAAELADAAAAAGATTTSSTTTPQPDGKYQLAVQAASSGNAVWVSTNFGQSWTQVQNPGQILHDWWRAFVSSSGSPMFISSLRQTFVSYDYGTTWTKFNDGPALLGASSTGQYQAAANRSDNSWGSQAPLCVTRDTGAHWTQVLPSTAPGVFFSDAIVSSNGSVMATLPTGGNTVIRVSRDYGQTWSPQATTSFTTFTKLAMSSSGQYMTAAALGNGIFISSNYGATFTSVTSIPSGSYVLVAVSCSGQYQVAVAKEGGSILLSSNYGVSWSVPTNAPSMTQWWWVDISCSGKYITAVAANSGGMALSSDFGVTWSAPAWAYSLGWSLVSISKSSG